MTINEFEYIKFPEGYKITGYKGSLENIIIPEGTFIIGVYAFSGSKIKSVKFPKSLKHLHDGAFEGCGRLTRVDFSLSAELLSIGANAFSNTGLLELIIPDGVEEIGYGAFSVCRSLMRAYVPSGVKSMDWNIFEGCSSLKTITVGGKIPARWGDRWNGSEAAVQSGKAFASAILEPKTTETAQKTAQTTSPGAAPKAVKRAEPLPQKAEPNETPTKEKAPSFAYVKNEYYTPLSSLNLKKVPGGLMLVDIKDRGLRELILPPEITVIGDSATVYSKDIEKFKATGSLKSIGYRAFSDCYALKEIEFPFSTSLRDGAFDHCLSLECAILTTDMGNGVYNRSGVRSILYGVSDLAPTLIPDETFMDTSFREVKIPESVKHIGRGAFRKCQFLEKISFGKADISFGEEVFSGAYSLKSFEFTDNMPSDIPRGMFFDCVGLENIKFGRKPGSIGTLALVGVGMKELKIPKHYTPLRSSVGSKALNKIILEGRTLRELEQMGCGFVSSGGKLPYESVRIVCEDGIKFHKCN